MYSFGDFPAVLRFLRHQLAAELPHGVSRGVRPFAFAPENQDLFPDKGDPCFFRHRGNAVGLGVFAEKRSVRAPQKQIRAERLRPGRELRAEGQNRPAVNRRDTERTKAAGAENRAELLSPGKDRAERRFLKAERLKDRLLLVSRGLIPGK